MSQSLKRPSILKIAYLLILLSIGAMQSCADDSNPFNQLPDPRPIEAAVKTAIPLVRVASKATLAAYGTSVPNTTVIGPSCTRGNSCNATVQVQLLDGLFPIHSGNTGVVEVVGHWNNETSGVLLSNFIDINAGSLDFSISSVATFPVEVTAAGARVVYAELDLQVNTDPTGLSGAEINNELNRLNQTKETDPKLALDMNAWVVEVDFNGTLSDETDDLYSITGGGQQFDVGKTSVKLYQLALVGLEMSADCNINPTSGIGLIQEIDSTMTIPLGQAFLTFANSCDGTAKITLGNGSFIGSTGDNLDLGF